MNVKEKIEELLEASEDGTITAAQVTKVGLHRSILQEFVKSGEMYRFGRGQHLSRHLCGIRCAPCEPCGKAAEDPAFLLR